MKYIIYSHDYNLYIGDIDESELPEIFDIPELEDHNLLNLQSIRYIFRIEKNFLKKERLKDKLSIEDNRFINEHSD